MPIKTEEFDYQTYTRENAPDPTKIRSYDERQAKWQEAAENKTIVALDREIVEKFEQLGSSRKEAILLMNTALREWLTTRDMKQLIKDDFQHMLADTLASFRMAGNIPESAEKLVAVK